MSAEIDLTHIVIFQHGLIPRIGGVVSSTVIDGNASGKGNSTFQGFVRGEFPVIVLEVLTDVSKFPSGSDNPLCESPDLSLNLCRLSQVLDLLFHQCLLRLILLVFYSRDSILLDLVMTVALELVVGEFYLHRGLPAFQYSETLVCLGFCR